ncbi:MAG TPA: aldehyde dehydrogenase family protein [Steroidobacteraceae bacterium]|nr:aldehyde dehydrogenase family protein [Steroidobacteraceae bacterium]
MSRYQDKVAVVTGSAAGIGRAIVQKLIAEGAHVLATDINRRGGADALAAEMGARCSALTVDVTKEDHADRCAVVCHSRGMSSMSPAPNVVTSVWTGELDPNRTYKLLIDGQFVEGAAGETFQCEYPFTGEKWGAVPVATDTDVDRAVRAADKAFRSGWSQTTPAQRAALLRKLANLVREDERALALLQVHENGKRLVDMQSTGALLAALAEYMAGLAETSHGYTTQSNVPGVTSYDVREPLGVVAAITPWNSPLLLLAWKLLPALAAGNTVIAKPSEVTPLSTLRLAELCMKAGFPEGVINVVTGYAQVGRALVNHPLVHKIAFTGATSTGLSIAGIASARGARVTLELGGKSPNIIFADANLERAIDGVITGIFSATGQSCISGSRILLEQSIGDEFLERLAQRVAALKLGDPLDPTSEIAPLASRAHLQKVLGYIDIAKGEGAKTLVGGGRPADAALRNGFFVEPTLFTGVDNDFRIAREEVFGPVGAIIRFKDEAHAVRLANDTEFGLAAALWTENVGRAHRIIPQLRAGTVWVNQYRTADLARPFGGYKHSGLGRELGLRSLDPYTEVKSVFIAH